jgi:hypothetical protein
MFYYFFVLFLQMLYVDNLQHGFQTSPFSIPRCSFLDSKMIQAILNEDRRGDVAGKIVEFGHLRVCFSAITLFFPNV